MEKVVNGEHELSKPLDIQGSQPRLDIVVQRQLDTMTTGNNAYLQTFLIAANDADLSVRVVFAPWRSFGNRPWASIHPQLDKLIDDIVWPSSVKLGTRYWSVSPRIWWRFGVRICKEFIRRLGVDLQIPTYFSTPLESHEQSLLTKLLNSDPAEITVAEYSSLGPILKDLSSDKTVRSVLMHDVLSDRGAALREGGMTPNFDEVSAAEEASWISTSKLNIYASRNELQSFGPKIAAAKNVWLRPSVPHFAEPPLDGEPRIVFIGTTHAGNTDSIIHFYDAIWPKIRRELPATELYIAGSVGTALPKHIQMADGIHILGRVDDLADLGGPQSVTIAPTRIATGVSIKVAEYLLLRTACVAYPRAIQGFGDALDGLLEVSETDEAFAGSVIRLLQNDDERRMLADRAGDQAPICLANNEVVHALREAAGRVEK